MALPDLSGTLSAGSPALDLVGRVLAGRYRLVAPVGVGASARVYLAEDVQLRRRVAVKVLHPGLAGDPTFLRRFQAEAQAAAALNHPHVVAVYDWGRDASDGGSAEPVPFLVTEYLDGGSLRTMLDGGDGSRGSRLLTLSQALVVGLQVCRGLHYAHSRGFVHRDIKPANLLFGEDRRLRIADFGLARALAEASWTEPEGVVLGTARYVSPEQAAGLPCDTRSDLYSLALVLVECVTGSVPNTADTAVATLAARVGRDLEVDRHRFGPLAPLIEAAGRADPAERATAAQLGAGLMAAAQELTSPEPLPLTPLRPFREAASAGPGTRLLGADDAPLVVPDAAGSAGDGGRSGENGHGNGEHPDTNAGATTVLGAPVPTTSPATPASGLPGIGASTVPGLPAPVPPGPATRPRRRRRRPRLRTLFTASLVLSALALLGLLGFRLFGDAILGPPTHPVPSYVGRDVDEVRRELDAVGYGWQLRIDDERRDGVPVGRVLAQAPMAGAELAEGDVLRLVRAAGNTLVTVPSVAGSTIDAPAVTAAFEAVSLEIDPVDQFDENAAAGTILAVEQAGRSVEKFSTVRVTVSAGPAPRTLKDYVATRQSVEATKADLTAAGLVPEVVTEASEEVAKDSIIRTEPAAGQQVPKGGKVRIVVSSGPPLLTVPDVYGMTGREAEDYLVSAGWRVTGIDGPSSGTVIGTDPEAGIQRVKGSPIRIITRSN